MLIELPRQSGGWPYWDKVQHITVFATLTYLACWAFPRFQYVLAGMLVIYGAVLEWMQAEFTTTRLPSLGDWFADVAGVMLVMIVLWLVDISRSNKVRA